MVWFIFAVIFVIAAVGLGFFAVKANKEVGKYEAAAAVERQLYEAKVSEGSRYVTEPKTYKNEISNAGFTKKLSAIIAGVLAVLGILFFYFSTVVFVGVGEAKVVVNFDRTIETTLDAPGMFFKSPFQTTVDFDLFSQNMQFAGDSKSAPSYTGGKVTGGEITTSVARGATTNFDLSVTYSIAPKFVEKIYEDFKTQERFTDQFIVQRGLDVIRKVPNAYGPIEFRGAQSGEARDKMQVATQEALKAYGVDIKSINLQNIRFSPELEESIKNVEVAQQKEQTAAAELRATEISSQAKVVEAQAAHDANELLRVSLTPEILQQNSLDALVKIGEKGNMIIVPEGFAGILNTK